MKTKNTKKPMKVISLWNITLVVAVLLTALFPMFCQAGQIDQTDLLVGDNCITRPLSDFLDAQGSSSSFFAPVKDYVGWTDGNFTIFALVDYAGLANEYIKEKTGHSLGTRMRGSITQCALGGGRAQVTVVLYTTKALGFAQSIADIFEYGFPNAPTIFGAKAQDVVNGAKAAVGPVSLVTSFTIRSRGALPDFLDVINSPAKYAPAYLNFTSTTFECSDNRNAQLDVHEVAQTNDQKKWVYSVEVVDVVDNDGGNCGD
jgi:hypothetical protein